MKHPFRDKTPSRRIDIPKKNNYQHYKDELRKDFNNRCGYCNDPEGLRNTFYEIDHFIPKTLLTIDEYSNYENLVFACRYCNNSKRDKWPTNNRDKSNNGREGFIDPCSEEYDKLFERNNMGEIIPKSDIGKWIYRELKLYLYRHSLLWQIEKIEMILRRFRDLKLHEKEETKDLFIKISCYFQDYIDLLKEENAG